MSRLLSALRQMHHTGKWTPTINPEVPEFGVAKPAFTELSGKAKDLVLDGPPVPDSDDQGLGQAQGRKDNRGTENLEVIDVYGRINERIVALHNSDTMAAEQYRKLYIEIVQARRTRELQTLLITSALAGEGKSISAANLAITCAANKDQLGVLLIDTDFRKPSISQYLGIQPKWGLGDYLLGDVEYSKLFFKTHIPGLTIISQGKRVSNPTALLASTKIERFFQDLKSQKQYSYIVLDSSPVLLTSEAKSLLQYVDTTIFVVRANKTPAEVVLQAIRILGEENVLGCVLNGVTSSDFSFYAYYYNQVYYCSNNNSSQLT